MKGLLLLSVAVAATAAVASPPGQPPHDSGAVFRLNGVVAAGPAQATARIEVAGLKGSLRAASARLRVPAPWQVTKIRGSGSAGAGDARFRQSGEELRVLLVSLQGANVRSGSGTLLELQLRCPEANPCAVPDLRDRLTLVAAEAVNQKGDPVAVRLGRGRSTAEKDRVVPGTRRGLR